MNYNYLWMLIIPAALIAVFVFESSGDDQYHDDGRLIVTYWEKWQNFEGEAMRAVVDKYNDTRGKERGVFIKMVSTSEINNKFLMATVANNPPDVCGFWANQLASYAEKNSLTPLDSLMARDGITMEPYLPAIAKQCDYRGHVWGFPTTPGTIGLHYNKRLFREAGLDPDKPPRTMEELFDYAMKLTMRDENGRITQVGFLPNDPNWWNSVWVFYFHGHLYKTETEIDCPSPEFRAMLEWAQSYRDEYGADEILRLTQSGGAFDSPQNLFLAEKLAMQIQGVWMSSFIETHNPDLDWGAAPFPVPDPEKYGMTIAEADLLVIPRGSKHLEEAWDFIKFTQEPENMELLCYGQRKFSPLKEVSDGFYDDHPNPHIRVFRQMAESPHNVIRPKHATLFQYEAESFVMFDKVYLQNEADRQRNPEIIDDAMATLRRRVQPEVDRWARRWERVREARVEQWKEPVVEVAQ